MLDAYEYVSKQGLIREVDYARYAARQRRCDKTGPNAQKVYVHDMKEEDDISNERLMQLVAKQPVGVAMYSSSRCLGSYSRGIIKAEECYCSDPNRYEVNHAVTIVGYGKSDRPDCNTYWLIKNSWGPNWGEKGFFKLCADKSNETPVGTCQVNSYVQYPIA